MSDPKAQMMAQNMAHEVDALLRRCVQCGLCLPHCATFLVTGDEVQSPRGRLMLLKEQLDQPGTAALESFRQAFDQCIGCRACETACPGGVPFSLLEGGQEQARAAWPHNPHRVAGTPAGGFLLRRLDERTWLRLMRRAGTVGRRVLAALHGPHWRRRLAGKPLERPAQLLAGMPRTPERDDDLLALLDGLAGQAVETGPPVGEQALTSPGPVVLFRGCANEELLPGSASRLRALLEASGCRVLLASDQECCGALASHTGRPGRAAALRRRNTLGLEPLVKQGAPLLVEAAGCGLELREKMPSALAEAVIDVAVFLAEAPLPPLAAVPLRVVYHDPCHARHGQGVIEQPRRLLARVPGLQLLPTPEAEVCCGSGGAWGLSHPQLSAAAGLRKARLLAETGADLVVTSNPGCLGQIAEGLARLGLDLPILPLTDLLWYAWRRHQRVSD